MMSSMSSIPTEKRTSPGVMPMTALRSSGTDAWVMSAGTFTSDSTPPRLSANAKIFSGRIRRNVRLAESPGYGQSIFDYAPKSSGAADYGQLIEEVLAMESDQSQSRAAA